MPLEDVIRYVKRLPFDTEDGDIYERLSDRHSLEFKTNGCFSSILAKPDNHDYIVRVADITPNPDGPMDGWWEYARDFANHPFMEGTPTVYCVRRLATNRYVAVTERLYTHDEFSDFFKKNPNIHGEDHIILQEGLLEFFPKIHCPKIRGLLDGIFTQFPPPTYYVDIWGTNLLFRRDGTPVINDPICIEGEQEKYRDYVNSGKPGNVKLVNSAVERLCSLIQNR